LVAWNWGKEMIEGFENKKFPSVTIQGILLGTNLLLFEQSTQNICYVISIIILLALFSLQAVNHRLYTFFPINNYMKRMTPHIDTVILYIMIISAFLFTIFGLTNSAIFTAIATGFIVSPPFLWRKFVYPILRNDIAKKLSTKSTTFEDKCPQCGKNAEIEKKVKLWNEGEQIIKCKHCNFLKSDKVPLNIG
jgi:hypothetical protein